MLRTLLFSFILGLFGGSAMASETSSAPKPVANLDIERYQGLWHQLSAIPASFQKDCSSNTTAEYTLLSDGLIKVVNSCDQVNDQRKSSEARARVKKSYGLNSTLEVTFVKIVEWVWAFGGDYWVIYISDDYHVALVGHPNYEYGWVLSKNESLSLAEYAHLNEVLIAQGYDPCLFMMSKTSKQNFGENVSLCKLVSN